MSETTQVPNISEGAVSGLDHAPLTRREPSRLRGSLRDREAASEEGETELKGQALEDALEDRGLVKTGTADEKRARVAEYDANPPTDSPEDDSTTDDA